VPTTVAAAVAPTTFVPTGTPSQKVREWVSHSSFLANGNTLLSDISRLRRAAQIGSAKDVRKICTGLVDDAGTMYETLPTPSLKLTDDINAADETMARAANTCSDSSSVISPVTLSAIAQLGTTQLKRVQSDLGTFGVQWRARL
jgi:hypothetical protein